MVLVHALAWDVVYYTVQAEDCRGDILLGFWKQKESQLEAMVPNIHPNLYF